MVATAEELTELAGLARESGDVDLEISALEQLDSLGSADPISQSTDVNPFRQAGESIDSVLEQIPGIPLLEEIGAGIGRTSAELVDLVGTDTVNALLNVSGSAKRLPSLSSFTSPQGSFAGPGLLSRIAGSAGELAPAGLAVGSLFRKIATLLPAQTAGESAIVGTIRQLGAATPAADVGLGAVSGAGAEIGEEVAGPVGGLVGSVALPVAAPIAVTAAAKSLLQRGARTAQTQGTQLAKQADDLKTSAQPAEEGLKEVAEAVRKAKPEEVAQIAQPDPKFFQAVDELNINVEPLASFASQNPQFRALEQGLASIPASQLDAQSKNFIAATSQKADDLIIEYGGTLDKAALSDRFRQESTATIDDLAKKADDLYETLKLRIPPSTRVDAPNTTAFINQKAAELGGRKELPAMLNRVLRQLETTTKQGKPLGKDVVTGKERFAEDIINQPTHERLNQTRKEVGQALNKRSGPFKDQETGLLKAMYKRLRNDQDAIAINQGAGDVSEAANAMIRQRKQMEDNLSKLLGRDLQGSILPVVGQSLKRLAKGDIQKWDSTMNRIPSKAMRQEIVVSALNDIFKGNNVQGRALNPTQFTKFMNDLDAQPAIKSRLFKELPEDSIKALENLRIVSRGISTALQDKIPTGRIAAFFDDQDGFLRRMMGKAISTAVTLKAGPLAGSAANEFINQTSGGAKTAGAVLASPQFQNIIRTAVREGVTEGNQISSKLLNAEKAFQRNKLFTRWANSLPEIEKAELQRAGTISYLLQNFNETEVPK